MSTVFSNLIWLADENGVGIDFGGPYGPSHLVPDVLPGNAKAFETAASFAMSDPLPVPIELIMDPDRTPERFLPFLAAHESVDLWMDDWDTLRKRKMIREALELAGLKGTHQGVVRYLGYVDAEVIDTIAYPARFVFGQSALGITPIAHPPFKARYLVKVELDRPFNAMELGRGAIGRAALRSVDLEPIRRAKLALSIARAPEAEYVVSFAWRRPARLRDAIPLSDQPPAGTYVDRVRL